MVEFETGLYDEASALCTICLASYEVGEELCVLPCDQQGRHHFHKTCVHDWLKLKFTCPVCRAQLVGRDRPRDPAHAEEGDVDLEEGVSRELHDLHDNMEEVGSALGDRIIPHVQEKDDDIEIRIL